MDEVDKLVKSAIEEAEVSSGEESVEEAEDEKEKPSKPKIQESFDSLVLPQEVYLEIMDILKKIAKAINEDWRDGDSIVQPTQALCQMIRESGMLDKLEEL